MKFKKIQLILYAFVSLFQLTYAIEIPKSKLDQIKLDFKKISTIILKLGQTKMPNPFGKDIEVISQALNSKEITDQSIKTILTKLNNIKVNLSTFNPNTTISIPTTPGKSTQQSLGSFIATTYKKFISDIKLILEKSKNIVFVLNDKDLKLLRDNFKLIFFGFYELFEHPYYKYLETIRTSLHFGLNKEKLELIKDTMELLLNNLNTENPNQTITIEVNPCQRRNVHIKELKDFIKQFINTINTLIK